MSVRTPLGRVEGLGAAHRGTEHFISQRVTAIALVPLSLWLIISLLHVSSYSYADVVLWMSSPVTIALLFAASVVSSGARLSIVSRADRFNLIGL